MVNRILSLQLVFTLAASQAWAITGGPYEGQLRLTSMAGTYGVSLNGTTDNHKSTTGVMLLSVPTRGLAVAKALVFDQGLMFAGTATGTVQLSDGGGSLTLLTQLTHYVTRTSSDGTDGNTVSYADSTLNGLLKLKIKPDYFSGITAVSGQGNFWSQSIRLTEQTSVTTTITDDGSGNTSSIISNTVTVQKGADASDSGTKDTEIITDSTDPWVTVSIDGLRQSTTASVITNFTIPQDGSNWGVGINDTGSSPASAESN